MQQLRNRLEQIDQQILESRQQGVVQSELFLVINRLEEFAGAVTEKLDTIDLETKRRIVLGLVKRVEIHKDEIVVVFRVDPQPGALDRENSNDSDDGVKSMQRCTRRTEPPMPFSVVGLVSCASALGMAHALDRFECSAAHCVHVRERALERGGRP